MEFKEVISMLEGYRKFTVQFFETWVELVEKNYKVVWFGRTQLVSRLGDLKYPVCFKFCCFYLIVSC
jgi:hypothetical protein